MRVEEPATAAELAQLLGTSSRERRSVLVRGAGTKLSWGREPAPVDLVIATRGLSRLLAHADGDLTATVEAGMSIESLNEQLATHRQWLPIESAFHGATIGGILATNDCGALRHRYGTPRDLLIGITLATTEGSLVKAGGTVVKNVAGYDLGKLVTGSFGSLAVIVNATFKLTPVPVSFVTARARFASRDEVATAAAVIAAAALDPLAIELHVRDVRESGAELLIRFGSSPAAAQDQAAAVETLMVAHGGRTERLSGGDEYECWKAHQQRPWLEGGAVLSAAWLPAVLPQVLAQLEELAGPECAIELVARAGLGHGLLRVDAPAGDVAQIVERLRRSGLLTHVTVLRAEAQVKSLIDVWPDPGAAGAVLAALKRTFDPMGILNAGRGPL